MRQELQEKLYREFPNLYGQKDWPMNQTCMCWGIDCGDGWFDIIYDLSKELSKFKDIQAIQVKEKYGELRFYTNFGNEEVWNLIDKATDESLKTCEVCGRPGKPNNGGWIMTRCEIHEGQ